MIKRIFCISLLCLCFNCFSEIKTNPQEEKIISDLCKFRTEIKSLQIDEAVSRVDKYLSDFNASDKLELSNEIILSVENILIWEKYNLFYEKDIAHPELEPLIKGQYEKIKAFFKEHKKEEHSKWLYTTGGDVLSSCMQFLPLTTAMNEGLTVKKYYDDALEQDENFVYCLINIAQWYYFAPAINGGGLGKATKFFEKALENSKTDDEIFNSKLFLSQAYFEAKKYDECKKLLSECETLIPETRVVKHYSRLNEIGYSYYDYCLDRKKIDKKL